MYLISWYKNMVLKTSLKETKLNDNQKRSTLYGHDTDNSTARMESGKWNREALSASAMFGSGVCSSDGTWFMMTMIFSVVDCVIIWLAVVVSYWPMVCDPFAFAVPFSIGLASDDCFAPISEFKWSATQIALEFINDKITITTQKWWENLNFQLLPILINTSTVYVSLMLLGFVFTSN